MPEMTLKVEECWCFHKFWFWSDFKIARWKLTSLALPFQSVETDCWSWAIPLFSPSTYSIDPGSRKHTTGNGSGGKWPVRFFGVYDFVGSTLRSGRRDPDRLGAFNARTERCDRSRCRAWATCTAPVHSDWCDAAAARSQYGDPGSAGRTGRPASGANRNEGGVSAPSARRCDRTVSCAGHPGARHKNSLAVSKLRNVWPVHRHRQPRLLAWWLFGKRSAGFSLLTRVMEDAFPRGVVFREIVFKDTSNGKNKQAHRQTNKPTKTWHHLPISVSHLMLRSGNQTESFGPQHLKCTRS